MIVTYLRLKVNRRESYFDQELKAINQQWLLKILYSPSM